MPCTTHTISGIFTLNRNAIQIFPKGKNNKRHQFILYIPNVESSGKVVPWIELRTLEKAGKLIFKEKLDKLFSLNQGQIIKGKAAITFRERTSKVLHNVFILLVKKNAVFYG